MATTQKQQTGNFGESVACEHLENKGFRIIERNRHISKNEIDIIAEDAKYIIFVEVKTRAEGGDYGSAGRAVDRPKRKGTVKAAQTYLATYYGGKQPRIDIIEVYLNGTAFSNPTVVKINHIENAFDARGRIR